MTEIKFSPELSEKLGEDKRRQIDSIFNFEETVKEELERNDLTEESRNKIAEKMVTLAEFLSGILIIGKGKHYSDELKAYTISDKLSQFNFENFSAELTKEIEEAKKSASKKIPIVAKATAKAAEDRTESMVRSVRDNIELNDEALGEARNKESALKKKLKECEEDISHKENEYSDKVTEKQTALEKYKSLGFFGTLKRMLRERSKVAGKKQGIFTVIKNAYLESSFNMDPDYKESAKDLFYKICDEQKNLDTEIKKLEMRKKELEKELKSLKKEAGKKGKEALEKVRVVYDEAIRPVSEINRNNLKSLIDKVDVFCRKAEKDFSDRMNSLKNELDIILKFYFDAVKDSDKQTNAESKRENIVASKIKTDKDMLEVLNAEKNEALSDRMKREGQYKEAVMNAFNVGDDFTIGEMAKKRVIKGVRAAQFSSAERRYKRKVKEISRVQSRRDKNERRLYRYKSDGLDR